MRAATTEQIAAAASASGGDAMGKACSEAVSSLDTDVGLLLAKHLDGFAAGRSLGYQLHIELVIDHRGNPLAQKRMIVDAEHPDSGRLVHRSLSFSRSAASDAALRGYNLANHFLGPCAGGD